jgi:hypothetical protein
MSSGKILPIAMMICEHMHAEIRQFSARGVHRIVERATMHVDPKFQRIDPDIGPACQCIDRR